MLMNDVRQPLSPNAVRALAAVLADPAVGIATGNLVLSGGAGSGVYWRYENWIRRQESRFRGMAGMTGPIAMVRRDDLPRSLPDIILDDVWIPMKLVLGGKRVAFVTEAEARDAAFEDDREFKRKVRTLAGNYQLFARIPALLSPFAQPDLVRDLLPQAPAAGGPLAADRALRRAPSSAPRRAADSCRPSRSRRSAATAQPRWGRAPASSARWRERSSC